jgi:hypothetical protein
MTNLVESYNMVMRWLSIFLLWILWNLFCTITQTTLLTQPEVFYKYILRRGVYRELVLQECLFRNDGILACSCPKPRLLHRSRIEFHRPPALPIAVGSSPPLLWLLKPSVRTAAAPSLFSCHRGEFWSPATPRGECSSEPLGYGRH